LFEEFVPKEKMKRLMLLATCSLEQPLTLAEFDKQMALFGSLSGTNCDPFLERSPASTIAG
jgi:hypothetical protein